MTNHAASSPEQMIERLQESGLRGRGGGWFPAARKWRAVRAEAADPFRPEDRRPLVIANGAEGEPGSVKDRHVMITRAGDVVAGLALAARAVGATEAVFYLKGSFARAAAALEAALAGALPEGVRARVHRGDDSYVEGF